MWTAYWKEVVGMSAAKKRARAVFNEVCIKRDERCRLCPLINKTPVQDLEVHHITNRNDMPKGGYVKENGITLCKRHHLEVETSTNYFYSANYLYELIGSSYEKALDASKRL